jgi:hypothetical protein
LVYVLLKSVQYLLKFLLNKNPFAVIFSLTRNLLLAVCLLVDVLLILTEMKHRGLEL